MTNSPRECRIAKAMEGGCDGNRPALPIASSSMRRAAAGCHRTAGHILTAFDAAHPRELARRVETERRALADLSAGPPAALGPMGEDLELHLAKEEQGLFPLSCCAELISRWAQRRSVPLEGRAAPPRQKDFPAGQNPMAGSLPAQLQAPRSDSQPEQVPTTPGARVAPLPGPGLGSPPLRDLPPRSRPVGARGRGGRVV